MLHPLFQFVSGERRGACRVRLREALSDLCRQEARVQANHSHRVLLDGQIVPQGILELVLRELVEGQAAENGVSPVKLLGWSLVN